MQEIGQRHSTILLKNHLSSIAVYEEIKPDIFDINREMPTDAAMSFCSTRAVDSGLVRTRPLFPFPYYIYTSNRSKTRSERSQRNVLALIHLHDAI